MKSLFKVSLLATTLAVALNAPAVMAATSATTTTEQTPTNAAFKDQSQQSAYALGASGSLHGQLSEGTREAWYQA